MKAAGVVRLFCFFAFAAYQTLSGGEGHCFRRAEDINNLALQIMTGRETEHAANILGRGWFMPGMSVVLAPIRLLTSGATLGPVVRSARSPIG